MQHIFENYKIEADYETHFIFKISIVSIQSIVIQTENPMYFQFQFVNSFLALFYTAFYLQDIDKLKEVCSQKSSDSLTITFWVESKVSRYIVANIFSFWRHC